MVQRLRTLTACPVLILDLSAWYRPELPAKRNLSRENAHTMWSGKSAGISLLKIMLEGPDDCGQCRPGLVVSGGIRNQAWPLVGSRPVGIALPPQSLPQCWSLGSHPDFPPGRSVTGSGK